MKQKTLNLMEEAISAAGKWIWMDVAYDSIQLEFENVQLYHPKLNELESHSSIIAIRLAGNVFFQLFYNENDDEEFENEFLDPDNEISYNLNNKNFKFQDFDLFEKLFNDYKFQKDLLGSSKNSIKKGGIDFLLCFTTDKVGVAIGSNQIHFFNEFNLLNDDEIKILSNKWWVYWVDYWKKNSSREYDPACEVYPLVKDPSHK